MKVRESGMPEQYVWESYFDPDLILAHLGFSSDCHDVVEIGCGYGTFTIPAARRVTGTIYGLDIDASTMAVAKSRAEADGISNVRFLMRDVVAEGTGLKTGSMNYAMLFNLLHHDKPVDLLREAYRNLRDGGLVGIIHWISDPDTPRGPPLCMRPRPEQCRQWAEEAGFSVGRQVIDLPPYHYGLVLEK